MPARVVADHVVPDCLHPFRDGTDSGIVFRCREPVHEYDDRPRTVSAPPPRRQVEAVLGLQPGGDGVVHDADHGTGPPAPELARGARPMTVRGRRLAIPMPSDALFESEPAPVTTADGAASPSAQRAAER